MSSKKTKLLESAQKNVLKGQLDRAIAEYRQIIELDPSDLRHRQKIAELLTKAKRNDEAIKEYTNIAKNYIDSVYYLKAIAVYKQIQKLDPVNPEIALTLASLNEKQGLIGNAVAEYASAVQIYEKSGENLKALKSLENIMSLDSGNSAVKLRIAEKYFTTGSEDKSFETFASLLNDLRERSDENGFSLIAERAYNFFGDRVNEILGQTTDINTSSLPSEIESQKSENVIPLPEPPDNQPETAIFSPDFAPDNEPSTDSAPYEEIEYIEEVEYIEDIIPIDDDEHATFAENNDEWEEEIELPSLDAHPESIADQDVDREVLEELDTVVELDEIELELEIDNELSIESALFSQSPLLQADDTFDLGKDLSLFADELDFDLLSGQDQDTAFDITNSGFKKGELDNEDAESHYSLGLAYKEMGLWDEAIAEFIVASRSSERKIDSLILQGSCLREIGSIAKAIEILSDTLRFEGINEDECLGVQYELALCHEASGDFDKARSMLKDIMAVRETFSDAATRLKNLPA